MADFGSANKAVVDSLKASIKYLTPNENIGNNVNFSNNKYDNIDYSQSEEKYIESKIEIALTENCYETIDYNQQNEFLKKLWNSEMAPSFLDLTIDDKNKPKVSITGKIDDFTDYQMCTTAPLLNTNALVDSLRGQELPGKSLTREKIRPEDLENAPTMYDLYLSKKTEIENFILTEEEIKKLNEEEKTIYENDLARLKSELNTYVTLFNNGFGDLRVVEAIQDEETGLTALVLLDADGNFMISYNCTESAIDDVIYDVEQLFPLDVDALAETAEKYGFDTHGAGATYEAQQEKAVQIAQYYYDLAEEMGTKLNVNGYSLGGGLAEHVYLNMHYNIEPEFESGFTILDYKNESFYNQVIKENENADKVMGDLIVYEPFHQVEWYEEKLLKDLYDQGKINIFAAEGSTVSSVTCTDAIADMSKYVYVDYVERFSEGFNYDEGLFEQYCYSTFDIPGLGKFDLNAALNDAFTKEEIESLRLLVNNGSKLFMGAAHTSELVFKEDAKNSFDADGKYKDTIEISVKDPYTDQDIMVQHKVGYIPLEEILTNVYKTDGTKQLDFLKELARTTNEVADLANEFDVNSFDFKKGLIPILNNEGLENVTDALIAGLDDGMVKEAAQIVTSWRDKDYMGSATHLAFTGGYFVKSGMHYVADKVKTGAENFGNWVTGLF